MNDTKLSNKKKNNGFQNLVGDTICDANQRQRQQMTITKDAAKDHKL